MKRCPYCDEEVRDNAVKCRHCGERLTGPARPGADPDTLDDAATRPAAELHVRQMLAGRYRIEARLGSGGMGEVWKAADTAMDDTPVAIKVLPAVLARDPHSVRGLKREAAIASKLTHPNICRLHSFDSDGDIKFLVMEYVKGRTLEDVLHSPPGRRFTLQQLLALAHHVASAVDHAHGVIYTDAQGRRVKGILHGDIKPSNIILFRDGRRHLHAKVLDFGIAREMKDSMTRVTGKEASGARLYMSQEQFSGQPPTTASDVYSLAATLYECLAGHPPLHQGSIEDQLLQSPPPIEGIPESINRGLQVGLAKQPGDRPRNAAGLAELLQKLLKASKRSPSGLNAAQAKRQAAPTPASSKLGGHLRSPPQRDQFEGLAHALGLSELLKAPLFHSACSALENLTRAPAVIDLFCTARCAASGVWDNRGITQVEMAFEGSRILYTIIYEYLNRQGEPPELRRAEIDAAARTYCSFLNKAPAFTGKWVCRALCVGEPLNVEQMELCSRPAANARVPLPRVLPRSCLVCRHAEPARVFLKARVDLLCR